MTKDEREMIKQYRKSINTDIIFEYFFKLVRYTIKKASNQFQNDKDFEQQCLIELNNSLKTYKLNKKTAFNTYFTNRLKLITRDWKINSKSSRSLRTRFNKENIVYLENLETLDNLKYNSTIEEEIYVKELLDKLTLEEQDLYELYFVAGHSFFDISSKYGCSHTKISSKIKKIQEKLKKLL